MAEILLASACFLAAVTVIGHGLWVAVSWIFKGGTQSQDVKPVGSLKLQFCPRCGLELAADRCRSCDWPQPIEFSKKRPIAALDALTARIEQLANLGLLEPAASQQFSQLIAAERQRLSIVRATSTPAPKDRPQDEEIISAALVDEGIAATRVPRPRDDREFASEVPVEVRVAQFKVRQEQPAAAELAEPPPPGPTLTDWLSAFMEERNMRWGELVGGLLIVCCSIALVVSFWSAIAERPLLKFLLFNGVTACLFGIGFHSEHRWRLHTTSQGLLIIATLLVPLNFLAIAAFSRSDAGESLLRISGEAVSVALFSALVYWAGKIIVDGRAAVLVVGVLVPSLAQLLVRRYVDPLTSQGVLAELAALPVACYMLVNGWVLQRTAPILRLSETDVNGLFKIFGVTTFAALLPLGLLLVNTDRPMQALHHLPMVASLLGAIPLAVGLLLWRKLSGTGLTSLRMAGTSMAVFGALVSLSGLVLGWPDPILMLPSALVEFGVFTFIAWRFGLPAAHGVAAACLALSYLLWVYLADHQIARLDQDSKHLAEILISGPTGTLLAPLAIAYAAAAYASRRAHLRSANALLWATALLAGVSVALVSWFGLGVEGDPIGAAWVYLLYAVGCMAISARSNRAAIAWLAATLLLAAVSQAVIFRLESQLAYAEGELAAILLYGSLSVAIAMIVGRSRWVRDDSPLGDALWNASFFTSLLAALWLVVLAPTQNAGFEAGHWLWLAALWLAVAASTGWLPVWTLFQTALGVAAVFGIASQLETRPWFAESDHPWLDPWTWQAVGVALAALNLAWAVIRIICRYLSGPDRGSAGEESWSGRAVKLLNLPWLAVDRATSGALVALVVLLGTYAALPGVRQELSPTQPFPAGSPAAIDTTTPATPSPRIVPPIENFQLMDIPHVHAAGWGSWLLLASLLALLAAMACERASQTWLLCLFVVAAVSCPLLASRWEGEAAVASALRWLSAGLLLCGSVPIWGRGWLARRAARLGYRPVETGWNVASNARGLVFFLGLVAPVAMALGIGVQALGRSPRASALWTDSSILAILWGISILVAGAFWKFPIGRARAETSRSRPTWPLAASALALVLGTAPILSVVLYHVGVALEHSPILGPDPDSIFFRMGLAGSYAAPVLMTALALVGYAVRERSSGFALAGGLVLNAGATTAYLLAISKGGLRFDGPQWIRLAQLNAAVAAGYALAWLAALVSRQRKRGRREPIASDFLLDTQVALAPALMGLTLGWAWGQLVWEPEGSVARPHVMNMELADPWGWISLASAAVCIGAATWAAGRRLSMAGISAGLTALAILAAVLASPWDLVGNWVSYNTLFVGHLVSAAGLVALTGLEKRQWFAARSEWIADELGDRALPDPSRPLWIVLQGLVIFALGVRELGDGRWWSAGGFAFLGILLAPASAWVFQRRRYLYVAGAMINLAGMVAWAEARPFLQTRGFWHPEDWVYLNVILLTLPVVPWLLIELGGIRPRTFKAGSQATPFHRVATRAALFVLTITLGLNLFGDARSAPFTTVSPPLDWFALMATAIAGLACLWDVTAKDSVSGLYLLGLLACGMLLDQFNLAPEWLLWTGNMVVAAYAVLTSYLWSRRRGLLAIADRLGIPRGEEVDFAGLLWLVPCNLALVAAIVVLTVTVELTNRDVSLRVLAAQATLAQVVSLALLARGDRRGVLQMSALQMGAVGAVMFGWAWLQVDTTLTLLHALVVLAAALGAVATLYGFGLGKLLSETSDWLAPARKLMPWLAALSAGAIVAILAVEVYQFSQLGEVQIAWPAILVVAVTLAGLSAAALAAAILPGRDPLGLSERGRTLYVYAAETILALLFVHIRLTLPWLFSGLFQQYWPLIVMAIAFSGVGFAEFCRRREQRVLSEPLENTGALLPVLPVLSFWATNTEVHYSLLLLLVGVLYAGLSIARRSFGFGVLAALAANGGLWYFLGGQEGFGFLAHPQIWLIPPALCVLAAAYLNRDQLNESQMTGIRYFTSIAIYTSSTADIFLNGVAQAPWLPLVLAGISVLGILAGIALRARAFLFLGTSFLVLALFTMIWHAAVDLDQTWIWWVSGIGLGILILVLFGLFEKKRQEILEALEKLKQWEG